MLSCLNYIHFSTRHSQIKTPNTWVIQILNQSIFKKEILNHFFPHIHTHCASRFTGLVFVVGFFFVLFSFIFWKCPLALKNFPFFQVVDLIAHNAARCLFSPTFRCVICLLLWAQSFTTSLMADLRQMNFIF